MTADRVPAFMATRVDTGGRMGTDESVVLLLAGELDIDSAPQLTDALSGLLADGPTDVVLDLSALTFLDSTGLSVLIRAQKRLDENDRRLVIRAARPPQVKLFETTRLTSFLNVEIEQTIPTGGAPATPE